MTIFDSIEPPDDPQRDLIIELKYGTIQSDMTFLNSLPDTVVTIAYREAYEPWGSNDDLDTQRLILSIMLCQQPDTEKARAAIKRALALYHTMVG